MEKKEINKCAIKGCNRPMSAKLCCTKHYQRYMTGDNGTPWDLESYINYENAREII